MQLSKRGLKIKVLLKQRYQANLNKIKIKYGVQEFSMAYKKQDILLSLESLTKT